MSSIASTLLSIILAMPVAPLMKDIPTAPVAHAVAQSNWVVQENDKVILDTLKNYGFLFHEDGTYLSFPIVTGQRRYVSYIGRYYNASTPNWDWTIKGFDIKGDRVTFGPDGRFLRMFKDGDDRTAYGFHEHRDEEEMFSGTKSDQRYRSMGCVIVRHEIMEILVQTYESNQSIDVISRYGVDDLQDVMMAFKAKENLEQSSNESLAFDGN